MQRESQNFGIANKVSDSTLVWFFPLMKLEWMGFGCWSQLQASQWFCQYIHAKHKHPHRAHIFSSSFSLARALHLHMQGDLIQPPSSMATPLDPERATAVPLMLLPESLMETTLLGCCMHLDLSRTRVAIGREESARGGQLLVAIQSSGDSDGISDIHVSLSNCARM